MAPPGTYAGVGLTLGLNGPCNTSACGPASLRFPSTSQIVAAAVGYLFLRYEALLSATGAQTPTRRRRPRARFTWRSPGLFAPVIRVDGALSVPGASRHPKPSGRRWTRSSLGATSPVDLTDVPLAPGDEVAAGERLRQNAPGLPLFTLGP